MNMYYNEVLLVTTTEGLTNTGPYNHCFFIARIKSNELGRFRLEMMCPPKKVESLQVVWSFKQNYKCLLILPELLIACTLPTSCQ